MITTIVRGRAPGVTLARMPFFVWSQLVTALLLLLAFPALQAAAVFQLMDRVAGTSFFLPSGLVLGGIPLQNYAGGGSPLLWQHLFWFLAHPEVYVLILPAMGIVVGGDCQQHAAAAVGLRADGRGGAVPRTACRCWCGRTTCS